MKYIRSNKSLWSIVFLSMGYLFWTPFKILRIPFENIALQHFSNLLGNSLSVREYIKIFATQGILIVLLSFVIFGSLLIYGFNRNKAWSFKLFFIMLIFLLFGAIGSFLAPYKKYSLYEISAPFKVNESGNVITNIQFKALDDTFKHYLTLAEKGKINCSIATHLVYNQNRFPIKMNHSVIAYDQNDIKVSSEFIKKFIEHPLLVFEFALEPATSLVHRHLPKEAKSRQDTLFINGKKVNIPSQGFLIYFKFESLGGKPLAVFL